ncbi:hypothetical protein MTO96_052216 [Rhipicephalus appendiculatus]
MSATGSDTERVAKGSTSPPALSLPVEPVAALRSKVKSVDTNIYVIGGTSSVLNGPIKRPEVYLQQDDKYKFPAEYPEAMTGISAVCVPPVTPTFRSQSLTCMITDTLAE